MRKDNFWHDSLLKMKQQLVIFLTASIICGMPISAYAQIIKISIKKSNATIATVLNDIEKQSDYTFFYSDNQLKLNKKVSVNVKDAWL